MTYIELTLINMELCAKICVFPIKLKKTLQNHQYCSVFNVFTKILLCPFVDTRLYVEENAVYVATAFYREVISFLLIIFA